MLDQGGQNTSEALMRLVNGFQVSQALHVAATLGLADLLTNGPRSSGALAEATDTHEPSLYRLLRALAAVGVLREEADRHFALTALGDGLRSDAPEPVGGWAAFIGQPYFWNGWALLLHSVRTGESGFRRLHGMTTYEYRAAHPDLSAAFDRAMTDLSRREGAARLAAYDFGRFGRVVDVGGGQGALLAGILAAHSGTRGVLFDQPHVVTRAEPLLRAAGVADRCRLVGGNFFEAVPEGGDAYVLKSVLHNWTDDEAVAILRIVRQAMGDRGTLIVLEQEIGPPNEGAATKFSDLNMLVAAGGQERTREEYAALFAASGFRLTSVIPAGGGLNLFEGAPVLS